MQCEVIVASEDTPSWGPGLVSCAGRHKVTKKRQHLGKVAPEGLRWHGRLAAQQLFLRPLIVVVKALHPYVVEEVIDIVPQHLYGIPLNNTDNTSIDRTLL